ncbi:acetylcholine receptor subunit epsilon-like [Mercenaria mercenaria]|uniref:acetylcholine receptor subunit epsilon-like n=1 Tax=Mercenaria mercenaria TaxID=6596 RepID=UPI00234E6BFB|nr:acetylcholine receptor subunit epsilon-like [Mercenaria mercenaria]
MAAAYIVIVAMLLTAYGQNNTFWENKRLHKHLEGNMDDKIRPLINQSSAIAVLIDVHLQAIQGLNEKEQQLESTIAIACHWNYETLVWNKSDFGGITGINISPKDAWIPELVLSNSVESMFLLTENRENTNNIAVMSNGDATWFTGGHLRTGCHIDITKYPFDTQTCTITISKTVSDSELYIRASSEKVTTVLYDENSEWSLKRSVVKTRALYEYITFLDIHITLARHSLFYTLNVVVPVALLSFMTVLCFKVPVASGERLSYSMALLLTFVVLLNLISESMPRVPKHISYLQLYVNCQLTIAFVITTLSIMLVNISYPKDEADIPCVVKLYFWYYNYRKRRQTVNLDSSEETAADKKSDRKPNTQPQSGTETVSSLDRSSVIHRIENVLFWGFMAIFICSTIMFLILVTI